MKGERRSGGTKGDCSPVVVKDESNVLFSLASSTALGLLSSSCCLIQLALAAVGSGCLGVVKALEPYRAVFLTGSLLYIVHQWYVRPPCHRPVLAASTFLLVALCASPAIVQWNLEGSNDQPQTAGGVLVVAVEGMGCNACALSVKGALEGMSEAVSECQVSVEDGIAQCALMAGYGERDLAATAHDAVRDRGFVVRDVVVEPAG